MGTYLYAHVEISEAGGVWSPLCSWDFGKSYELMDSIDGDGEGSFAAEGWPADTYLRHNEEKSDVYAKRTSTLAQLQKIKTDTFYSWERDLFRALLQCCESLDHGVFQVRVLWGCN